MSALPSLPLINIEQNRDYQLFSIFKKSYEEKWSSEQFTLALKPFLLEEDDDLAIPFIEGLIHYNINSDMRDYAFFLLPYFSKQELLIIASKYIPISLDYLADLIPGDFDWNTLKGKIDNKHLSHIIKIKPTYADYPDWMTNKPYVEPTNQLGIDKLDFNEEDILNQIKEKVDIYSEDNADIDEEEIKSIGTAVMSMLVTNGSDIQIYGPVNGKKRCQNGKDCHMFTCNCFDDEFAGQCDGCELLIRNKRNCLRMPVENGGWIGWYHSYECLIDNTPEPSLAEVANLKMLKSVIDKYGILKLKK